MYTYYCKDTNCPGHTKSWERCCDMRAFSTDEKKKTAFRTFSATTQRTPSPMFKKQVFA